MCDRIDTDGDRNEARQVTLTAMCSREDHPAERDAKRRHQDVERAVGAFAARRASNRSRFSSHIRLSRGSFALAPISRGSGNGCTALFLARGSGVDVLARIGSPSATLSICFGRRQRMCRDFAGSKRTNALSAGWNSAEEIVFPTRRKTPEMKRAQSVTC
jgi:hypothetical protein